MARRTAEARAAGRISRAQSVRRVGPVVASRGGRPRAPGRRRGRATAWVWWYPREKGSQASSLAQPDLLPTFLRSHHLDFATPSHPGLFSKLLTAGISILTGGRGRSAAAAAVRRRRGPTAGRRIAAPLPRPEGGALFCIEVVVRGAAIASAVVGGGKATCSRRARDVAAPAPAAAAAVSRDRDGAGSGVGVGPRWAAPLAAFVFGGSRPLAAVRAPRNRAAADSARPTPPRRPRCGGGGGGDRRAPPAGGAAPRARRAAGAGVFAPRQRAAAPRRAISALATARRRP